MSSEIKVDTISEKTSANGVTIDGLTIKDGNILGDVALAGTTPTFTVGDGGAEDAALIFDGNELDYYMALDDSANNLIIGSGSTVGSNSLITIDSDGDLSLDIAGDILLDAGGADIRMISGGTDYCKFTKDGNNTAIKAQVSDGDLILRGSDSGSQIDALTLDMSDAGTASFNHDIKLIDGAIIDCAGDLTIDVDGADLLLKDGGSQFGQFENSSLDFIIKSSTSDKDLIFQGNDGGSEVTALTLDMSDAGAATFNSSITASGLTINGGTDRQFINNGHLRLSDDYNLEWGGGTNFIRGSNANNRLIFQTNSSEAMRIDSSQQVGIGTSSPSSLLHMFSSEPTLIIQDGGSHGTNATPSLSLRDGSGAMGSINFSSAGLMRINQVKNSSLTFSTNNTERMRLDGSGNVGIGTSSPGQLLEVRTDQNSDTAIKINNQTGGTAARASLFMDSNSGGLQIMAIDDGFTTSGLYRGDAAVIVTDTAFHNGMNIGTRSSNSNAHMRFYTTDTERMRIDNNGSLLVATTNADPASASSNGRVVINTLNNGNAALNCFNTGTSAVNIITLENGNGNVGRIQISGSSTTYLTSSDYRIKENVSYDFDATSRLKQLKPARFNFITNKDETVDGFLAHEVSDIVPEAISGEKDAIFPETKYEAGDDIPEGKEIGDVKEPEKINPQGIDQSKLVPLMVKAIQELEARIKILEDA